MPSSLSARPGTRVRSPRSRLRGSLVTAAATAVVVSASLAGASHAAVTGPVAALPPAALMSPDARDAMLGPVAVAPTAPAAPAPVTAPAPAQPVPVPVQALAAAPAVVAVVPAVVRPAAPLVRNLLVSADGSLRTGVGTYSDCSGNTPLTRVVAAIDTCIGGPTYFVGHDPGVFTPLMSMSVGEVITWYDRNGNVHPMRIVSIRDGWASANGAPRPTRSNVVAQMQTCEPYSPSGDYDRIVDLVAA
ncbi:MAG TPA: hypothetical protein VH134_05805 [Candidatus Dormibacteraeota bacterium]|nr:hypothetical protein [Candidatus Dormibacteraeota bacterium]